MSLAADDEFLGAIAQQARLAYATQLLDACRTALQNWQAEAAFEVGARENPRVQHELAYYTTQVERWQEYLRCLGQGLHQVGAARELTTPDAPQGG
jgi:hypothetical protein